MTQLFVGANKINPLGSEFLEYCKKEPPMTYKTKGCLTLIHARQETEGVSLTGTIHFYRVTCTHGNTGKASLQQWGFMLVSAKANRAMTQTHMELLSTEQFAMQGNYTRTRAMLSTYLM